MERFITFIYLIRRKLFKKVKKIIIPVINDSLWNGKVRLATYMFILYNILEGKYKKHWIKGVKVLDLKIAHNSFHKKILSDCMIGHSFPPMRIDDDQIRKDDVHFPPIHVILFSNVMINACTSAIYSPHMNTIFLQRISHRDENDFIYHHEHLAFLNGEYGLLRFPNAVEKIVQGIFLSGTGSFNFYHYLLEFISKIEYVEKLPARYRDFPLLVHEIAEQNENFYEYLKLANTQKREIIFLAKKKTYEVENLIQISNPSICPFNIRNNEKYKASYSFTRLSTVYYLRNLVLPTILDNNALKRHKRIFLTRKQENRRKYNQEELMKIAKKYGFEEIYLEEYNIYEQAFIIHQADLIIGPTGAAWTNLLFARSNAKGLCWMSDTFGDLSVYSNIANAIGFKLYYLIYPGDKNHLHASFYLNPEKFENSLMKLLKMENSNVDVI